MSTPANVSNKVLLIDDSEDDYEAVMRSFKKAGFDTPLLWCKTGEEALAMLKADAAKDGADLPHLILLDLNMPGLDGNATLELIKLEPALRHIPIVIFTTSSNERDIKKSYQNGASSYVQKPIGLEKMIEVAKNLKNYWFGVVLLPPSGTGYSVQ